MSNDPIFPGIPNFNTQASPLDEASIFWHLDAIGVLNNNNDGTFDAPQWPDQGDAPANPATVAIIDTGIDTGHPNLEGAIDPGTEIDFATRLLGARYQGAPAGIPNTPAQKAELSALFAADPAMQAEFDTLYDRLVVDPVEVLPVDDPSRYFGAHGTACAGLVGGRPKLVPQEGILQYYGANPFCRIVPITTPYSHEIRPMIHALIYAYLQGAEVIYIPRGMPDYDALTDRAALSPRKTRILNDPVTMAAPLDTAYVPVEGDLAVKERLLKDKTIFETLLQGISTIRYVVLAAGNDGRPDAVSYPAAVSGFATDAMPIVVTAQNAAGLPSSYANGADFADALLDMPSDDGFAIDQERLALNPRERETRDYNYLPHLGDQETSTFSYWGVLSLDVRGSYGYAVGLRPDPPDLDDDEATEGLYTIFGGTSAASAIAAGLVSLLVQNGKLAPTPITLAQLKAVLAAESLGL
ncbi:S8 family serine peptidase [Roseobacter weihaiensis]|uniref:S8 family serine peptidase n=1 Tax=Roseobacter weihaiensis TaxID=2763262 RepID=UPI001D0A944E|nr:S8 family serine peptidase [Roseobacter sp. H9]